MAHEVKDGVYRCVSGTEHRRIVYKQREYRCAECGAVLVLTPKGG